MKGKHYIALFLFAFALQQCAKQTAPTGGPKDETPPTLIKSSPTHEQINVTKDEIELTFDELVQLNNARDQLIITPGVGKKIEATARKNRVSIKFNSELKPNTTYSINFREAIQDLTEKNPALIKLAFSTGDYIDSLSISGRVKDILLDKYAENYTIALAEASDTFSIFKHSASWITLADKQGKFILENLKPGNYILYAFNDKNKNLIVDSKSEKYGFQKELVTLTGNVDSVKISVFKLDTSPLRLISSRPTFSYYNIKFSKSLVDYSLTATEDSLHIESQLDADPSSIKVYNTIESRDSIQMRIQATDSIENKVDTLVYLKFNTTRTTTKDKFTGKIESANFYEPKSLFTSTIVFSKPVASMNTDSVFIQLDSINRITFSNEDYTWNKSLTQLTLSKRIEVPKPEVQQPRTERIEKKDIDVQARKKTEPIQLVITNAISVERDTLGKLAASLKTIKPEDTGIISAKIETAEDFIIQIVDKNSKVIFESKNQKNYAFENLAPGSYQLRVIIDTNKNGKWDPGNFLTKTEPEPILYYSNPKGQKDVNMKANWEVGPLLISY